MEGERFANLDGRGFLIFTYTFEKSKYRFRSRFLYSFLATVWLDQYFQNICAFFLLRGTICPTCALWSGKEFRQFFSAYRLPVCDLGQTNLTEIQKNSERNLSEIIGASFLKFPDSNLSGNIRSCPERTTRSSLVCAGRWTSSASIAKILKYNIDEFERNTMTFEFTLRISGNFPVDYLLFLCWPRRQKLLKSLRGEHFLEDLVADVRTATCGLCRLW
jgi:hypothetical protein